MTASQPVPELPDIQSQPDSRKIEIDEVGIGGLRLPVTFDDDISTQSGIADVAITVTLPGPHRGTHMSRMVEWAHSNLDRVDPRTLTTNLKDLADRLDVHTAAVEIRLPFASRVTAPQSARQAWQAHDLTLRAAISPSEKVLETTISTDVTTVCPCSKAISDYGAHNQRSRIALTVYGTGDVPYPTPVATIVDDARSVGSFPVLPIVKRSDERAMTMNAHDQPKFVEDVIRDLTSIYRSRQLRHRIAVRNLESIHSHDAIAGLAWRGAS